MSETKHKHTSPDEIEFGDATLIGIAQPVNSTARESSNESAVKSAEPKANVPAPASTKPFSDEEATVVGGKFSATRAAEAPPIRVDAKLVSKVDSKIDPIVDMKIESKPVAKKVEPRTVPADQPKQLVSKSSPEVDFDRTIVERANPLKEAFDARTLINSSQPKRFNPDETQINPPPKVERQLQVTSAIVTTSAIAQKAAPVEKSRVPDSRGSQFPDSPRFGHTLVPDALKKNSELKSDVRQEAKNETKHEAKHEFRGEPRKTLLDDAPAVTSRKSRDQFETPADTFSPHHERSQLGTHARTGEVVDAEDVDDSATGEVPHERKPSAFGLWLQKMRSRVSAHQSDKKSGKKSDNKSGKDSDISLKPEAEFGTAPPNNRMRNAMIASGAAILVAVLIMKFTHSSDEATAPEAAAVTSAQHRVSHQASASSEAPRQTAAAAPNQGPSGGSVASFIQQFDRAFAKTQDQR